MGGFKYFVIFFFLIQISFASSFSVTLNPDGNGFYNQWDKGTCPGEKWDCINDEPPLYKITTNTTNLSQTFTFQDYPVGQAFFGNYKYTNDDVITGIIITIEGKGCYTPILRIDGKDAYSYKFCKNQTFSFTRNPLHDGYTATGGYPFTPEDISKLEIGVRADQESELYQISAVVQFWPKRICTETDGGKIYDTKGETLMNGQVVDSDSCIDTNTLHEAYCTNIGSGGSPDYNLAVSVNCPSGCTNGACKPTPQTTCNDTDGGFNPYQPGTTKASIQQLYDFPVETGIFGGSDSCSGYPEGQLQEYTCDQGILKTAFFNCKDCYTEPGVGQHCDSSLTDTCGDGICGFGETASTCPSDCSTGTTCENCDTQCLLQDTVQGEITLPPPIPTTNQTSGTGQLIPLITDTNPQRSPDISGNYVIYTERVDSQYDVFAMNTLTKVITQVTATTATETLLRIDGNHIIYMRTDGNPDIFLYDIQTGTETRLTNDTSYEQKLEISGNLITYQKTIDGQSAIYVQDITTGTIRTLPYQGYNSDAKISGNILAYTSYRGGIPEGGGNVYYWNMDENKEYTVATGPMNQLIVGVNSKNLLYYDINPQTEGTGRFIVYDLATTTKTELPIYNIPTSNAILAENRLIYKDPTGKNVMAYDISTGESTTLSTDIITSHFSGDGNGVVIEKNVDWTNYDIYLYDFTGTVPTGAGSSTGTENASTNDTQPVYSPILIRNSTYLMIPPRFTISGDKVAWIERKSISESGVTRTVYPIYIYDITTGDLNNPVTIDQSTYVTFDYSDDIITWVDKRSGTETIYYYDTTTGIEKTISGATPYPGTASIDKGKIVWQDGRSDMGDIYLYDISTGQQKAIAVAGSLQDHPYINGDKIVWRDFRNNDIAQIYMYDLATSQTRRITDNTDPKGNAAVSGNHVAYLRMYTTSSYRDIWVVDLSTGTETKIRQGGKIQLMPDMDGDKGGLGGQRRHDQRLLPLFT
ncbi:MAG: hypothetical protein ABIJ21_05320 [Nanoarchaeota archaeon]